MSADERPFRLEKGGTEGIGSKPTVIADACGNEGLAPVR
jgi:hypothetical protein